MVTVAQSVLPTRPRVRAVVVNYRGTGVTRRCVESLLDDARSAVDLSVVVVDNSPDDGVAATLRRDDTRLEIRTANRNEGFARGCNLGMADLDGIDAVALVNNDAVVLPGWLDPLVGRLREPRVGAASPKLLLDLWADAVTVDLGDTPGGVSLDGVTVDGEDVTDSMRLDERWADRRPLRRGACAWWRSEQAAPPRRMVLRLTAERPCSVRVGSPAASTQSQLAAGSNSVECSSSGALRIVNSAGVGLYTGWVGGDIGFLEPDIGQYDERTEVFGWCGGAVLLRADYLRDVGLFDPTMFVYYEDFDLSCRGRIRGWRHVYEPSSTVLHEHGWSTRADSGVHRFWNDRNRRIAVVKNAPRRAALRAALGAPRGGARVAVSVLAALPGALVRRRQTRRRALLAPAALEEWMKDR